VQLIYPSLGMALGDALDASRSHRGGVMPAIVTDRHRRSSTGSCVWGYSIPANFLPFASMAICEPLRGTFSLVLVAVPREGLDGREGLGWET
jgi:hypothetical protein